MSTAKRPLRLATYLCPGLPVELFELLMDYLERYTGLEAILQYESRAGGPLPGRADPFQQDLVDLAFMSAYSWARLRNTSCRPQSAMLLPVTPVFSHARNKDGQPGYYADVVIHADAKKHVKELLDLRGATWVYSSEQSLSGYRALLRVLGKLGENASFFGNTLCSGSHLQSLRMVASKQAETAAVDANSLAYYRRHLPNLGRDLYVLDSVGPLPPYPIVINSHLDGELKDSITRALKSMHQSEMWRSKLTVFGIQKFVGNSTEEYDEECVAAADYDKDHSHSVRYY